LKPFKHVGYSSFSRRFSSLFTFGVVDIEELGIWMGIVCPSVFADVENFGFD